MTSSIGQGAYGNPTHIPIPNSQFQGSTSGIGGQSTLEYSKYDPSFGFQYSYVPGSKRFSKLGGYRYNGPTGNWGSTVLRKVNLRKQTTGAAGILSSNPLARLKINKFIALNYGLQKVDKFLPRGGNVPRVVDTSNVEDPKSFYSDYNWGNPQQTHIIPPNGYYTIPPNDTKKNLENEDYEPEKDLQNPPNTPISPKQPFSLYYKMDAGGVEPPGFYAHLNPMHGVAGLGNSTDFSQPPPWTLKALKDTQDAYNLLLKDPKAKKFADYGEKIEQLKENEKLEKAKLEMEFQNLPMATDFARRRANSLSHVYDSELVRTLDERKGVNTSSTSKPVFNGEGFIGGIEVAYNGPELSTERPKIYYAEPGDDSYEITSSDGTIYLSTQAYMKHSKTMKNFIPKS